MRSAENRLDTIIYFSPESGAEVYVEAINKGVRKLTKYLGDGLTNNDFDMEDELGQVRLLEEIVREV